MSKTLPQPLYHAAYRGLVQRIEAGDLAPGDRLPSERWLCNEFGVSRSTIRRAIEELVAAGLIDDDGRVVGGGVPSLTDIAQQRGLTATARVLDARVRAMTLDEADVFNLVAGTDLFELRRLRYLDGLAVAIDHDHVPLRYLPNAMKIDFSTASLYAALADNGHRLVTSRMQISAVIPTAKDAKLLGLERGAPVLDALDHASDATGRVIDIGRTIYRSDRHRFLATFTRTATG